MFFVQYYRDSVHIFVFYQLGCGISLGRRIYIRFLTCLLTIIFHCVFVSNLWHFTSLMSNNISLSFIRFLFIISFHNYLFHVIPFVCHNNIFLLLFYIIIWLFVYNVYLLLLLLLLIRHWFLPCVGSANRGNSYGPVCPALRLSYVVI